MFLEVFYSITTSINVVNQDYQHTCTLLGVKLANKILYNSCYLEFTMMSGFPFLLHKSHT